MTAGFNEIVNDLDERVAVLEQQAGLISHPLPDFDTDPDDGTVTPVDPLDWSVAGTLWESYSQVVALPSGDPDYPGWTMSTSYPPAAVHLVSGMCTLAGLVRRKAGGTNYTANTRSATAMFALPDEWRPVNRVLLPCLVGNADPSTITTVGIGMVEVRPETETLQPAGIAYFITGSIGLTAGTGWVSLLGSFPCVRSDNSPVTVEDAWNDVPPAFTWESIDPGVTWDSYPNSTT